MQKKMKEIVILDFHLGILIQLDNYVFIALKNKLMKRMKKRHSGKELF